MYIVRPIISKIEDLSLRLFLCSYKYHTNMYNLPSSGNNLSYYRGVDSFNIIY